MIDFVDRLLGRSEHPPIRPALPTLFEPSRAADPDELPLGVFSSPPAVEVPDPAGIAPAPAATPPPPAPAPAPGQPAAANPVALPSGTQPPSAPRPPGRDTRETVRATTVPERSLITSHTETSLLIDRGRPAGSPGSTPPAPTAAPPSQRSAEAPRQPAAPTRAPRATPVGSPPQPPAVPRRGRRDPDVHVTIGRVEIKAAAGRSAGPQRSTTAARRPPVTLEDYLKTRGS